MPEENTFISFCFCSILYCYLSGDDDTREKHLAYLERALPSLKLFRDLSIDQIAAALGVASSELNEIAASPQRSITDKEESHMSVLARSDVGDAILTFLLSFTVYFGSSSEKQREVIVDVADACDIDVEEAVKPRLTVLRQLYATMPGAQ